MERIITMSTKSKISLLEDLILKTLNGKGDRYPTVEIKEQEGSLRFDIADDKYGCWHIGECLGYQIDDVLDDDAVYNKLIKEIKKLIRESVLALNEEY